MYFYLNRLNSYVVLKRVDIFVFCLKKTCRDILETTWTINWLHKPILVRIRSYSPELPSKMAQNSKIVKIGICRKSFLGLYFKIPFLKGKIFVKKMHFYDFYAFCAQILRLVRFWALGRSRVTKIHPYQYKLMRTISGYVSYMGYHHVVFPKK